MDFKIDTKEKLHVITLKEPVLSGNLTEALRDLVHSFHQQPVKNLVIDLGSVTGIDEDSANVLAALQQQWYENNHSLVYFGIRKEVEVVFESLELWEVLNVTPTESEAWDIVQMEEIERELMG